MKEAFVSALLIIVVDRCKPKDGILAGGDDELDGLILWREIKRQIRILRDELDTEKCLPRSGESSVQVF